LNSHLHYQYTAVGHLTIDAFPDGSKRPGGSAFYSALQAARLGLRALVLTRGVPAEVHALVEPYRDELDVHVLAAERTTALLTTGSGEDRRQQVLAWAGPIAEDLSLNTHILHLAPVARETPSRWQGHQDFLALTPQGLARAWDSHEAHITHVAPARAAERIASRCQAVVVSHYERDICARLLAGARAGGAVVAVTAGAQPTVLLAGEQHEQELEVPPLEDPIDDLGAGDVFAAAFFIALSEGQCPADATRFANAAAAVRMRGLGAGAIGTRAEVQARLRLAAPGR
jgi:sugar/nucleoside kinase (ribokinase family)